MVSTNRAGRFSKAPKLQLRCVHSTSQIGFNPPEIMYTERKKANEGQKSACHHIYFFRTNEFGSREAQEFLTQRPCLGQKRINSAYSDAVAVLLPVLNRCPVENR